jgi:hypothetical protein
MFDVRSKMPCLVAALTLLTLPPPSAQTTTDTPRDPPARPRPEKKALPSIAPSRHILPAALTLDRAVAALKTDKEGFLRWNPPPPAAGLPAGTMVHKPPVEPHGPSERDPRVQVHPFVVRLTKGTTLSALAHTFKVPLEILLDKNCPRGEVDARRLKEGTDIWIPLFQNLREDGYALEGLRFDNESECLTIATRLLTKWNRQSAGRDHLAVAFQHLSPADRTHVIGRITAALDSIEESGVAVNVKLSRSVLEATREYADALRVAKPLNGIDNPFRLSPAFLVAITKERVKLRDPEAAITRGGIVTIIACKGDSNGAFPTLDGAVRSALAANRAVQYFEVGTVPAAVEAAQHVAERYGKGSELILIAGHGNFNHGTKTGEIHLAYRSVFQAATGAARNDMILYSSNKEALGVLTTCTARGGTILYLSCHSGAGGVGEDNIVKATVRAANDTETPLTVIGAPSATNLKSITFPTKPGSVKVEYFNCSPLEISSAPVLNEQRERTTGP